MGKIISSIDTMDYLRDERGDMEKAEQHIQNEYACNANMNEIGGIDLLSQKSGEGGQNGKDNL